MGFVPTIAQVLIAIGIYNVWLLRAGKATSWRGADATNMKEEFAAFGMAVLMLGAITMHIKVKDPLQRSLPAFTIFVLCAIIIAM